MTVGDKIKNVMDEKGITQYKLSKDFGIDQSSLSRLINGKIKNPSIDLLSRLSTGLRIDLQELIGDCDVSGIVTKKFIGKNLAILRGKRMYEEYADYLNANGGKSVHISAYFLKRFEKEKEMPAEKVVEYIADVENIDTEYFYKSIEDISLNAMRKGRDDLKFMDADIKRWVKDPSNYNSILLAYNSYKTVGDEKKSIE